MAKGRKKSQTRKDVEQLGKSAKAAKKTIAKISKAVKQVSKSAKSKTSSPKKGGNTRNGDNKAGKKATSSKQTKKSAPKKKSSKPATKKQSPSPELSSRRVYKFRDFPIPPQSNIIDYALTLENHPEIDQLLEPNEYVAFDLAGGRSTQLFPDITSAASFLSKYQLRQDLNEQVEAVKFVKFETSSSKPQDVESEEEYQETISQFKKETEAARKERQKFVEETFTEAREEIKKRTGKKPRSRAPEVVKGLLNINKALTDSVDAMNKQLAELQAKLAKLTKPAKKGGKKQNAPSKATKKKVSAPSGKRKSAAKGTGRKAVSKPAKSSRSSRASKPAKSVSGKHAKSAGKSTRRVSGKSSRVASSTPKAKKAIKKKKG